MTQNDLRFDKDLWFLVATFLIILFLPFFYFPILANYAIIFLCLVILAFINGLGLLLVFSVVLFNLVYIYSVGLVLDSPNYGGDIIVIDNSVAINFFRPDIWSDFSIYHFFFDDNYRFINNKIVPVLWWPGLHDEFLMILRYALNIGVLFLILLRYVAALSVKFVTGKPIFFLLLILTPIFNREAVIALFVMTAILSFLVFEKRGFSSEYLFEFLFVYCMSSVLLVFSRSFFVFLPVVSILMMIGLNWFISRVRPDWLWYFLGISLCFVAFGVFWPTGLGWFLTNLSNLGNPIRWAYALGAPALWAPPDLQSYFSFLWMWIGQGMIIALGIGIVVIAFKSGFRATNFGVILRRYFWLDIFEAYRFQCALGLCGLLSLVGNVGWSEMPSIGYSGILIYSLCFLLWSERYKCIVYGCIVSWGFVFPSALFFS